jgi:endogenous inhibitor of DNA gyrase (YacG/DUF329 family)
MARVRCPICDLRFEPNESPSPPFCSERCRRIDLARWLGESYRVSAEDGEEEEARVEVHLEDRD